MSVRFKARIRDERKFSGPEELKAQILRDIEEAKKHFAAISDIQPTADSSLRG
jgi:FAD synthase